MQAGVCGVSALAGARPARSATVSAKLLRVDARDGGTRVEKSAGQASDIGGGGDRSNGVVLAAASLAVVFGSTVWTASPSAGWLRLPLGMTSC